MAVLTLVAVRPAGAALGGDAASVKVDRQAMNGSLTSQPEDAYAVYRIQTPGGLVVKEFVSSAGRVFAITWRGPVLPNLRQLLGDYFDQYQQAADQARGAQGRRGMLVIHPPGLVVLSGGHMRAFFGKAYLPDEMPSGVDAGTLH